MHIKKRPRPKGRRLIIALVVLLLLAAAIVAVYFWQKNNIEAVKQFSQYSQEELEEQLQLNDQKVQDILAAALETAKEVDKQARPQESPTPETARPEPTPSPENITEVRPDPDAGPAWPVTTPAPVPTPEATPEPTPEPEPDMGDYEARLTDIVNRIYTLRDEYVAALDALQAEATAAYKAIPAADRKKQLSGFISSYLSRGSALERNCDGRMDLLVAELKALQKEYGQSMELVEAVKYTYASEKSLKKAWYMSELESRGFI